MITNLVFPKSDISFRISESAKEVSNLKFIRVTYNKPFHIVFNR